MLELLAELKNIVTGVLETIVQTTDNLDSIQFDESFLATYFGYAKYAMGSTLFGLFSTVVLIALGISIWSFLLKGFGYIRNLLPW